MARRVLWWWSPPYRLYTENILLRTADANTDLVICDFGLATIRGFKSYDEGPDVRRACGMRPRQHPGQHGRRWRLTIDL